jgi:hypothetical protein
MRYVKVVDGMTSNAGGFKYKLNEVNVAKVWNPKTFDPEKMGGFNFSTITKILRWVHRGNTIYDVIIPDDAEVIDCPSKNCPHGIFRANKIILTNPRKLTEEVVLDLYKKSKLPLNTYYQCLVVLLYKHYMSVIDEIIKDKIDKNNIDDCIKGFEQMIADKHDGKEPNFVYDDLWPEAKDVYDKLLKIKNNK